MAGLLLGAAHLRMFHGFVDGMLKRPQRRFVQFFSVLAGMARYAVTALAGILLIRAGAVDAAALGAGLILAVLGYRVIMFVSMERNP